MLAELLLGAAPRGAPSHFSLPLLAQAARKEPQNKEVRKELEALKKQEQKLKQEQKGMFGGMFANK